MQVSAPHTIPLSNWVYLRINELRTADNRDIKATFCTGIGDEICLSLPQLRWFTEIISRMQEDKGTSAYDTRVWDNENILVTWKHHDESFRIADIRQKDLSKAVIRLSLADSRNLLRDEWIGTLWDCDGEHKTHLHQNQEEATWCPGCTPENKMIELWLNQ